MSQPNRRGGPPPGFPGPGPGGRPGAMGFAKPKNAKKTISRLLKYLTANKKVLILVVLFMAVNTGASLAASYMLKPIINDYILPGDFAGLAVAILSLIGLYLLAALGALGQNQIMMRVAQKTVNTIRRDLFNKMQSLPISYFDTRTTGEVMSLYTNDIDNVQTTLEQSATALFSSILTLTGTVVMMIVMSPLLFLVSGSALVLMMFITNMIGKRTRRYFTDRQSAMGDMNGYIEETIEGLKVVKAFNHEQKAKKDFGEANLRYRQTSNHSSFYAGIIMPIMANLNNVAYAATAVVGGLLAVAGRFDIGSLAVFLNYSRQIGQPVNQITNQANNIMSAMAGAERIFALLDDEPETDGGRITLLPVDSQGNPTDAARPAGWAWQDGERRIPFAGDVRFENVTFSYVPEKVVLKDVSLFAKPGQKIAFVGSTGAGKTTITNLLTRFYDVQEGRILFDGLDIKDIKKADLRSSLSMVLQDTHLFTGTVLDNIRYGRPSATDEECIDAAKSASADSFIRRLPHGYDTVITGDGENLSQGQRQLLAIARAAVTSSPVLILDEATSSIDTRTERHIEQGMDRLMEGRTVFVIAHRLSTVRNAKAIMVIEQGEIIERGDHESLITEKGRYYQLYTGMFELE